MTFAVLDQDEQAALRQIGAARRWRHGAALYHEGDPSTWVALIKHGQVKVCTTAVDGYESILAIRGPGDIVGELSAIDRGARSATVLTLGPLEASVIEAEAFRAFLLAHPPVGLRLLEVIASRLRDADRKRAEFGAQDVTSRVARRLIELADRFGEPDEHGLRITTPLTQEELAGWVGASRESVSRALRTLRQRGIVRTGHGHIVVSDLDALRARAV